jgi:hypothetical protein
MDAEQNPYKAPQSPGMSGSCGWTQATVELVAFVLTAFLMYRVSKMAFVFSNTQDIDRFAEVQLVVTLVPLLPGLICGLLARWTVFAGLAGSLVGVHLYNTLEGFVLHDPIQLTIMLLTHETIQVSGVFVLGAVITELLRRLTRKPTPRTDPSQI